MKIPIDLIQNDGFNNKEARILTQSALQIYVIYEVL